MTRALISHPASDIDAIATAIRRLLAAIRPHLKFAEEVRVGPWRLWSERDLYPPPHDPFVDISGPGVEISINFHPRRRSPTAGRPSPGERNDWARVLAELSRGEASLLHNRRRLPELVRKRREFAVAASRRGVPVGVIAAWMCVHHSTVSHYLEGAR